MCVVVLQAKWFGWYHYSQERKVRRFGSASGKGKSKKKMLSLCRGVMSSIEKLSTEYFPRTCPRMNKKYKAFLLVLYLQIVECGIGCLSHLVISCETK